MLVHKSYVDFSHCAPLDTRRLGLPWCGMSATPSMSSRPDRQTLRAALVLHLTHALESARAAHQAAVEGATHGEARAENSKDTRGLEQSYVARGQAQRVAELEAAVNLAARIALHAPSSDTVNVGSLVVIDSGIDQTTYWLIPVGGGTTIDNVVVVTPASPLGKAMLGREVGDEIAVDKTKAQREVTAIW
jgi:transcription elongation GreA/GreB family factor